MQTIWLLCAKSRYGNSQVKIQLANNMCGIKRKINAVFSQNCAGNKYCLLKRAIGKKKLKMFAKYYKFAENQFKHPSKTIFLPFVIDTTFRQKYFVAK